MSDLTTFISRKCCRWVERNKKKKIMILMKVVGFLANHHERRLTFKKKNIANNYQ